MLFDLPPPFQMTTLTEQIVQFQLGSSYYSRPPTPEHSTIDHNRDARVPVASPSTPFDPDDLWDNLQFPTVPISLPASLTSQ